VGADIGSSQVKIPEKASPQQLEIFLQSVQQQVRDSGIVNFRPYSDLLVREARKAVARRDFESAELFARYACRLSPDLPIGYLVHALAQWAGNKFMVHRLGAGYWSACLAATRDMESLSFVTASILTCVVAAFLLTLTVFAGIAVVKLFSRALHDMAHLMPDAVPFAVKRGLTAVLFVAPLFAGMSLPATALYWLVLLFGYCGTRERIAICGFGAGCAVLPAAVGAICFC
ncbi:MAG: hypothetical protein GY868_21705, partial [Deltaproteobacteria bacterium]|nr:hypothetical protein [Deltaproteobacteria bacterium]